MDNRHLYQPDWDKVLRVLNGELPETTMLNADERSLLDELKAIKKSSQMYSDVEFDAESKISAIKQRLNFHEAAQEKIKKLWPKRLIAAAVATIIFGAGLFYYNNLDLNKRQSNQTALKNDVAPGRTGATLTLANGKKIKLGDAANGKLASEAGVVISKTADGQLVYEIKETDTESNKINTLSTARGETYQVRLPDGSLVALNAASSLEYPANFTALKQRRVKLTGEGYFEIAKDRAHPFIVQTDKQEVEVLGTHFNINSYADEPSTKTTLLEGSVRVADLSGTRRKLLRPGEQSALSVAGINVSAVDVDEAVAWKNGKFVFDNESIESIMRKLARWYDIRVVYQGDVRDRAFAGSISRSDNISKILDKITLTKAVRFKVEGREVTVMR